MTPTRRITGFRRAALFVPTLAIFLFAASLGSAAVVQSGNLRVSLLAQVMPYKLPRDKPAAIAVFVSGHVAAVSGGAPEQLRELGIKVNRHALLRSSGLPRCALSAIQPATTSQALAACGPALIGSGQFWAHIVLPEQGDYPTHGRLLVFNGAQDGHPVIYAHIYTSHPFVSSFVIPFSLRRLHGPTYGIELSASLPQSLGEWGYVDRIKLTLRRRFRSHGRSLSFFNAACPALPGTDRTAYRLALATFSFAQQRIRAEVNKVCEVRS